MFAVVYIDDATATATATSTAAAAAANEFADVAAYVLPK
jgi:hypothetical protein